jgi:hypothetical protein
MWKQGLCTAAAIVVITTAMAITMAADTAVAGITDITGIKKDKGRFDTCFYAAQTVGSLRMQWFVLF